MKDWVVLQERIIFDKVVIEGNWAYDIWAETWIMSSCKDLETLLLC